MHFLMAIFLFCFLTGGGDGSRCYVCLCVPCTGDVWLAFPSIRFNLPSARWYLRRSTDINTFLHLAARPPFVRPSVLSPVHRCRMFGVAICPLIFSVGPLVCPWRSRYRYACYVCLSVRPATRSSLRVSIHRCRMIGVSIDPLIFSSARWCLHWSTEISICYHVCPPFLPSTGAVW